MPYDIVIVPTYLRPEYLSVCLDRIANAAGGLEKHIWVYHDNHRLQFRGQETQLSKQVVESKPWFKELKFIDREQHGYVGNTFNCIEAYKDAYEHKYRGEFARYVYLIEDDVLVNSDFFRWHEAVQEKYPAYLCTVAWGCLRNPEVIISTDPVAYIESNRDFASIGVCWNRSNLNLVIRHGKPQFYNSPSYYLGTEFPNSEIPSWKWTEQDGLIMRILLKYKDLIVAWPSVPRCRHVGISGYHRPQGHRFAGTLAQRVAQLEKVINTPRELSRLSKDPFNDVWEVPSAQPWDAKDLHVVQEFK